MAELIAINPKLHAKLRIQPEKAELHSRGIQLLPVVPAEFASIATQSPIVLTKNGQTGQFVTVAMLGFAPGENLWFADSRWQGAYLPLHLQRQPFFIGQSGDNSQGDYVLCIDPDSPAIAQKQQSDGTETTFSALNIDAFHAKCEGEGLEANIYRSVRSMLSNYDNQVEIRNEFPKKTVERRNTGYAVDLLLETAPFTAGETDFNFCKLIAGSEGTLALITEIKLNVVPMPPKEIGLLCVHFNSVDEALRANLIGLKYNPGASELIDHYILECTKENKEQIKNRFFVLGDPGAILVIEFARETREEITATAIQVEAEMRAADLGYHFPLLFGEDSKKIWTLRKAGLGLLSNLPGDAKAVPVIEDTAVDVNDLPDFIRDFNVILKQHNLYSVHYAHAGSGEIHLRPIINLKTEEGNRLFRVIAEEIATLVKKYKGSLSGEHGDGRLRGEFIKQMVGEKNYQLLKDVKKIWDPANIFNPNKIVCIIFLSFGFS